MRVSGSQRAHTIPMAGGDEYDVFTNWRHVLCWCEKAGKIKRVKKRYNKRARRIVREEMRHRMQFA